MRELLERMAARFNERVMDDAGLREELEGLERRIQVVAGEHRYHMTLRNCRIDDLREGELDEADVTILTDVETLRGLTEKRIPPFKAIATGKLKVRASIEDALRLRKLIG